MIARVATWAMYPWESLGLVGSIQDKNLLFGVSEKYTQHWVVSTQFQIN